MFVLQSCMYVLYKESVYDVFRLHKILGLAHRGNYGRTFLVCIIAGLDTNILVEFVEIWLLTFILVLRVVVTYLKRILPTHTTPIPAITTANTESKKDLY